MRRLRAHGKARHRATRRAARDERGAASIIVAILLVVLMGCAALAVDVGAMYAEKAQLQNGADAAALAVAGDCAKGNCGTPSVTGSNYANNNANDSTSGATVSFPNATTVRVVTKARAAGSSTDGFPLYFARAMGFQSTDIGATAEAIWGTPSKGTTLPWTVSECVFKKYLSPTQLSDLNSTGQFTGDPTPTHILLRYDTGATALPGCAAQNGYQPGGFGWLVTDTGCSTNVSIGATVDGQPGNHFPNDLACNSVLATIMDEPVLIPLFSSATGNGSNAVYSLIGFAAFQVTGYKFSGSDANLDPAAPNCNGNCRGLQGFFARFVSLDEFTLSNSGQPNYGATVVALTQ
ncbi:hypothetical protein FCN77_18745 [Arthrobacter sp. 24S4-2]|nr:hypothetical protein FCN77_18745 [Arthrobacter sp. 24S4-2]